MPQHKHDFDFQAFAGRYANRIDIARFVEGVTAVINDVVDAAMDGVIDAAAAIPDCADEVRERAEDARDRFHAWRWQDTTWQDDDDPAEAMR
jgi:hypothetical protein